MNHFIQKVRQKAGFYFVPEHHLAPVMRWSRFHRWEDTGQFHYWPVAEEVLPLVSLGMRIGRFQFKEVVTRDHIPFAFQVVVRYAFDPRQAVSAAQAALAQVSAQALQTTVEDRAEQALRRKVSSYRSEEVAGQAAVMQMERDIGRYVHNYLRPMGITVGRDGVIVKEVIAPEQFTQAMLQVRQHRVMMRAFREQRDKAVIEQALWADFLNRVNTNDQPITITPPRELEAPLKGPQWNYFQAAKKRREH